MVQKPSVKDWRNLPIERWSTTTFREYLNDEHQRRYGIAYVAKNFGMEGRGLKGMIAEHGPEVVRAFIDACFADYKPTREWPGLNFAFMYSWQRSRILPRVLADVKRRQAVKGSQIIQAEVANEEIDDWL